MTPGFCGGRWGENLARGQPAEPSGSAIVAGDCDGAGLGREEGRPPTTSRDPIHNPAGIKVNKELLATKAHFSIVELSNLGGLVMPVILALTFEDDSTEEVRIPAEIWRRNSERVTKLLITEKPIVSITLDPHLETADIDLDNNHWPRRPVPSRFQLFKSQGRGSGDNPMRRAQEAETKAQEAQSKESEDKTDEADDT